jgi:RND family efflux transporter MFP subunit
MRKFRGFALVGLALGLAWTIISIASDPQDVEPTANQPVAIQRAVATMQTVPSEQLLDAVIEAVNKSTVSAQTSGRIIEVLVDVDDYVEKGAVLVRFRDKQQRAALKAAKARAAEAKSSFERVKDIYAKKLVSRADYDRAEANLKAANAAEEQAQEELEHTVVRAPYSGIVVKRHVEPGETANPGTLLLTGLSLESLRAVADIPQYDIETIRQLGRARVIFPGQDAAGVEGTKLTISPFADTAAHTFRVRVDLPQGQHGVYPGMFVKAAFVTGEQQRLLIPSKAVVHRSEVTAVYVITNETIHFRQIRTGRELPGGQIEVLAGLDEGEEVALDPIRAGVMLKEQRAGNES